LSHYKSFLAKVNKCSRIVLDDLELSVNSFVAENDLDNAVFEQSTPAFRKKQVVPPDPGPGWEEEL